MAGDILATRKLVLLMGINGAGKSMVAYRLAERLAGRCRLYSERSDEATASGLPIDYSAFDRSFTEPGVCDRAALHEPILAHCLQVIEALPQLPEGETIIMDRWYETYVRAADLPYDMVDIIEGALFAHGIEGTIVNLVVEDDYETMMQRLEHTRAHRRAAWWDASLGSIAARARDDLDTQRRNRQFAQRSSLNVLEIDTTRMQWDDVVAQILRVVQPMTVPAVRRQSARTDQHPPIPYP